MHDACAVTIAAELARFAGRIAIAEELTRRAVILGCTVVTIFPSIVSRTTTLTGIARTAAVAGKYIAAIASGPRP